MNKTIMLDIPASASERAARAQLVLETERRMSAVVDAAVEWHQSGQEGDGTWFDKAGVLEDAINALLELREQPSTPDVLTNPELGIIARDVPESSAVPAPTEGEARCVKCGHNDTSAQYENRCVEVIDDGRPETRARHCMCKCVFPPQQREGEVVELKACPIRGGREAWNTRRSDGGEAGQVWDEAIRIAKENSEDWSHHDVGAHALDDCATCSSATSSSAIIQALEAAKAKSLKPDP